MKYNPERIGSVLDQALAAAKGQGNFSLLDRLRSIMNGYQFLDPEDRDDYRKIETLFYAERRYKKILRSL